MDDLDGHLLPEATILGEDRVIWRQGSPFLVIPFVVPYNCSLNVTLLLIYKADVGGLVFL